MRLTFLGFTVPDELADPEIAVDRRPQVQTHVFAHGILQALDTAGVDATLLSCLPVSTYPFHPRIRFTSRRFRDGATPGQLLGFVNLLGLKHLSRLSVCLTRGVARLRQWQPDLLLIHGVHSPFLWFGVFCERVLRLPVAVVLTDPPGVEIPGEGALRAILHALDRRIVRSALCRVSGVVALTAALADDFAPGRPALVMEGICTSTRASDTTTTTTGTHSAETLPPLLVYAGGVTRSNGVEELLRAVLARDDGARLQVYGRGELSDWLSELASHDDRVLPPLFLSREEIGRGYAAADVIVQPRPVDQDFVPYSFPSKLIEYLAAGVPVVSTRLPGIPADYEGHLGWIENDTEAGINAAIDAVLAVPVEERQHRADEAADFITRTRSPQTQGVRLAAFLTGLIRAGA